MTRKLNTTVSARGKYATVTWFAGLFGLDEVNHTGPLGPSRRFAVVRVNEVNLHFYGISPEALEGADVQQSGGSLKRSVRKAA
jgi:hypothetical protein